MCHELSQCFNDRTEVSYMDSCINWSGLCDASDWLHKVEDTTSYRFFPFNRSTSKKGVLFHVQCPVDTAWVALLVGAGGSIPHFVSGFLDLKRTLPEALAIPTDVDDGGARIRSEKTYIAPQSMIYDLLYVVDILF